MNNSSIIEKNNQQSLNLRNIAQSNKSGIKNLNYPDNRFGNSELVSEDSLHEDFKKFGANAKEWTRKCILLLPEIYKRRIWRKKGFLSIYEYAAKLAGMSRNKVDEALWILNKISDKPRLKKIIEEKGINCVRPIMAIVTKENEDFWAQKAKIMSRNTLSTYVREFRKQAQNSQIAFRTGPKIQDREISSKISENLRNNAAKTKITIPIDFEPEVLYELQKLKGKDDWNTLFKQLLKIREGKLKEDKKKIQQEAVRRSQSKIKETHNEVKLAANQSPGAFKSSKNLGKLKEAKKLKTVRIKTFSNSANQTFGHIRSIKSQLFLQYPNIIFKAQSRHIPNKIKKYLLLKYNNHCAFPGCCKPYEIFHHANRFAIKKEHNPNRIFPLCLAHERLMHLGLIENEEKPPEYWKIRAKHDRYDLKHMIDRSVSEYRRKLAISVN